MMRAWPSSPELRGTRAAPSRPLVMRFMRFMLCVPCMLFMAAGCVGVGDPVASLDREAMRESPRPPLTPPRPPRGIDPSAFALPADPAPAAISLAEAIEEVRPSLPAIEAMPPQRPVPGDPQQVADEAVRAYLRGRAAFEEGNLPRAVGEFERAFVLDPRSTRILRQLGRAYAAAGNPARSIDAFRRLRAIEPLDPEALFSIGLAAIETGDPRLAAAALARLAEASRDDPSLDATPATLAAADFALCEAMGQLGFDAAFLESLPAALAHPLESMSADSIEASRVAELLRRRERLLMAAGDAMLRRGDPDAAAARYREALASPLTDPRPLVARLVHARLVAGRPAGAAAELAAVLAAPPFGEGDAEVELARHLIESGVDPAPLAAAVEAMLAADPTQGRLLRIRAILDPPAGRAGLREAAVERQDDRCLDDLVAAAREERLAVAAATVAELVAAEASLLEPAIRHYATGGGSWADLRDAIDSLPRSPLREAMAAQLRTQLRDPAGAWKRLEASPADADDPAIVRARIAAAAALRDASLLAAIERSLPPQEELLREALVEACLDAGAGDLAWRLVASRGDEADGGGDLPPTQRGRRLLQLSRAAAAEAAEAEGDRAELLRSLAARSSEAAIAADPASEAAWAWRLSLHDPRGGMLGDAQLHARLVAEAVKSLQDRSLAERIRIDEALSQGRPEEAMRRAESLLRRRPADPEALPAVAACEIRLGRQRPLFDRLSSRLERHAADPQSWDLWVAASARGGGLAEAESRLQSLAAADPDHPFAESLLASLRRSSGRAAEADLLAAAALARRPQTPAVTLERATLAMQRAARTRGGPSRPVSAASAEAMREAVDLVASLPAEVPSMTRGERWRALTLLLACEASIEGRDAALLRLAEAVLDADPDSPMPVHGAALLAAASSGVADEAFKAIATRAIESPQGRGIDDAAAARWLGIADRLSSAGFPAAAADLLASAVEQRAWPPGEARRILNAAAVALEARRGGFADATADRLSALAVEDRLPAGGRLLRDAAEAVDRSEEEAFLFEASNIYGLVGDREGSRRLLERHLEAAPDDAIALNNLGYARIEAGLVDAESEAMLERAHALRPEDPQILDSLGWLRYRQGRLADGLWGEGAVTLLRRAIEQGGEEPNLESLDHLGDALWVQGETEEATRLWQRVVEAGLRRFDRESTLRGIENFQRAEFGLVVVDPARFYAENLAAPVERARLKLRQLADRQAPSVAPSSPPPAVPPAEAGSG